MYEVWWMNFIMFLPTGLIMHEWVKPMPWMFNHMISEMYATGFEVSETILLSMKKCLSCFTNPFVEFLWGLTNSCRDSLPGVPLYLWDTTWRFIPITCTDSLSLMVLAWEDPWVSHSSNCCYFGSLSAWYFYIFPAFYCFPSWKTSIGGNVWAPWWHFTLRYMFCVLYSYPCR